MARRLGTKRERLFCVLEFIEEKWNLPEGKTVGCWHSVGNVSRLREIQLCGAREIYVAVPTALTAEPVRHFTTFTEDLRALVAWLQSFAIKTVAMESTSVYWIPLAELLEEAKIEVCLVNPRHVKNVPGRKSDVMDCQWLQYLHSVGLLRAAFRPAAAVRGLRALWRQRDALVRQSSRHIQHMHKALDQMNLQVHHDLADITGETGRAIVEAILRGDRDPAALARHRDKRVKATEQILTKALTGDYRTEHLFYLKQAYEGYQFLQLQIVELDQEPERRLQELAPPADEQTDTPKPKKATGKYVPAYDASSLPARLHRVDLSAVPGLNALTVQPLWSELGGELSAFPTAKHFTSWLGLCPDNRISGGKLLSAGTKPRPTAWPKLCAWPRRGSITLKTNSVTTTGVCGPNSAVPLPSPRPPINSPVSSMPCSKPTCLTTPNSTPPRTHASASQSKGQGPRLPSRCLAIFNLKLLEREERTGSD